MKSVFAAANENAMYNLQGEIPSNVEASEEDTKELFESEEESEMESESSLYELLQRMKEGVPDDCDDDESDESMNADGYHNKAVELARRGKLDRAAEICVAGLKKFPGNIDLLADVIKYSVDMGDLESALGYCKRLDRIGRRAWNWRAYTYSLDLLMTSAAENEVECRELIADYCKHLPHDEKSHVAESELEAKLGNHGKSMQILVETINAMPNAPRTALRLADLQLEAGLFQDTINTVNYAMMASAETQPSINTPYLAYVRCIAQDALLHRKVSETGFATQNEVNQVREQYEKLKAAFPIIVMRYGANIADRVHLLTFLTVN